MNDIVKPGRKLTYDFVMGHRSSVDLSELKVANARYDNKVHRDRSSIKETATTETHFCDLRAALLKYIEKADALLICGSWFTDEKIIYSLVGKKFVRVVVNKEDWLRQDSLRPNHRLRKAYTYIPKDKVDGPDPVRCMGVWTKNGSAWRPFMHHKFVVFAKEKPENNKEFEPYAVWRGSFNFTMNGSNSLDSASYTESYALSRRYFEEFKYVYDLSEELDWTTPWVKNEDPQ